MVRKKVKSVIDNLEVNRNTKNQLDWYDSFFKYVDECGLPANQITDLFPVFSSRQIVTRFIETYEYWKLVKDIPGHIIECGVAGGNFLMAMAHFTAIYEPHYYTRKVIGFDTFSGFLKPDKKDLSSSADHLKKGGLDFNSYEYLSNVIKFFDQNRMVGHIEKVKLYKGDISKTFKQYLKDDPSSVIGLLHLDLDLYKPTKDVIKLAWDRMAKGSIIIFDELHHFDYPGETAAIQETIGLKNLELKRVHTSSTAAYAIK